LNHFLNEYVKRKKISFDYFVVMDADTLLPPEFVSANIPFFYGIKNLALIQSTPTAYDTKSLLSRIGKERLAEWPKIVDNQFTQGYSNYFGWGGIFDIKIFRKKIKSFYEVVNEDTSVAYCYTLKNCKSIVSPIAPHSSMEPHDLISFWVRDKR
jgi:hypothetical protein